MAGLAWKASPAQIIFCVGFYLTITEHTHATPICTFGELGDLLTADFAHRLRCRRQRDVSRKSADSFVAPAEICAAAS
jgi:hypothetical protein